MSKKSKTIQDLTDEVRKFIQERDWGKYHTPKNIAESISIEAAELLEEFQWKSSEDIEDVLKDPEKKESVKEEVADVMIYCLSLANRLDIDLGKAIEDKIELNRKNIHQRNVKKNGKIREETVKLGQYLKGETTI